MNKGHITGHLASPVEIRESANGNSFGTIRLAHRIPVKVADGSYDDRTEWHTIFCSAKQAEYLGWLGKGDLVLIPYKLSAKEVTVGDKTFNQITLNLDDLGGIERFRVGGDAQGSPKEKVGAKASSGTGKVDEDFDPFDV